MCGISGVFLIKKSIDFNIKTQSFIHKNNFTLNHRGPNSNGYYADNRVVLVHNRLSIIDLSSEADQPMQLFSDGPIIIFNGEIYNYLELKFELRHYAIDWKTKSDTEVILALYEKEGIEGLKRLEGIFSICIWDKKNDFFILLRDRLGVKPLYYFYDDNYLYFSSEIKTLKKVIDNLSINNNSFVEYLWYGNTYENKTIYSEINQILPGQFLKITNSTISLKFWFKLEEWINFNQKTLESQIEDVSLALEKSITRQTISDVPFALFLSGGIDSSTIAAILKKNNFDVKCFTAVFDNSSINEYKKAFTIAHGLGLELNKVDIDTGDIWTAVQKLAYYHDEPFADAANVPLYIMSSKINNYYKVVLQGDGGDELFAGYRRYSLIKKKKYWKLFPTELSTIFNKFGYHGKRINRIISCMKNQSEAMNIALLLTLETPDASPLRVFNKDRQNYLETFNPFSAYLRAYDRFKEYNLLDKMLFIDTVLQLPSQFLTKVDRSTMAASIESRVPLLDEILLKVACSISGTQKMHNNISKYHLKKNLEKYINKELIYTPKSGFGVPYNVWIYKNLKEQFKDHTFSNSFISKYDINKVYLENLYYNNNEHNLMSSFLLWKIFQLSLWDMNNVK